VVLITYNGNLENVFEIQNNFGFCVPEYLNFRKTSFEKVNILENRIQKILEYECEKINIKTNFKFILKNIFRKNMKFEKYFSKTIKAKLKLSVGRNMWVGGVGGGGEEKSSSSLSVLVLGVY
jgi:hypothetical protein